MANNFDYILLTLLLFTVTVTASSKSMDDVKSSIPLVSFLERLQQTAFNTFNNHSNFDPKTYVDLPLKFPLSVTDHAFQNLPKSSTGLVSVHDLNRFIETYFEGAGDDLVYFDPEDFVPVPDDFLPKVKNPEVRAWAIKVHSLWKNLSRKVSSEVKTHPEFHTLLPVLDSVVIPGSRFREVYYWDSYWVIRFVCLFLSFHFLSNFMLFLLLWKFDGVFCLFFRGLLASKMYKTAKGIVNNLISFIEEYGFVLNGARAYYTNRRYMLLFYRTNYHFGP
jgi:alpha,alpha-trehalase